MGLFNKLAGKKEIYDLIVCPYCFSKYENDKVHFRDTDKSTIEKDEILDNFWVNFAHKESRGMQGRAYVPDPLKGRLRFTEFTDEAKVTHKKLTGYTPNEKANELTERICPYCHNTLPASSGNGSSKVIAVIGSTQIGKTVFINSVITELKLITKKYRTDATFNFITTDMRKRYTNIRENILNGTQEATDVSYIEPIICELKTNCFAERPNSTIISFYDFPGESTKEDIIKFSKRQIESADGLLVLFDLTQTETLFDGYKRCEIKRLESEKNTVMEKLGGITAEQINEYNMLRTSGAATNLGNYEAEYNRLKSEVERISKQVESMPDDNDVHIMQRDRMSKTLEQVTRRMEAAKANYENALESAQNQSAREQEIFGRALTPEDKEFIGKIDKLDQKTARLEEDRNHPNQFYNPNTDKYEYLENPYEWIQLVYNDAFGSDQKTSKPTAIVGTKSDIVVDMNNFNCINDELLSENISILMDEVNQKERFNVNAAQIISAFVERQLLSEDTIFTTTVRSRFSDFNYFAISALGTRYEEFDGRKELTVRKINPWRVDEPMLWLLYKLGTIE